MLVRPGAVGLVVAMGALVLVGKSTPVWQVLLVHVVLMASLAALFTPLFTMGLGALPPQLYSHGSSLLGTIQQVAGAMGTALVVMIMSSRSVAAIRDGVAPAAAEMQGMRWAFGVGAVLCLVVLGLVHLLPARLPDHENGHENGHEDAEQAVSERGHEDAEDASCDEILPESCDEVAAPA